MVQQLTVAGPAAPPLSLPLPRGPPVTADPYSRHGEGDRQGQNIYLCESKSHPQNPPCKFGLTSLDHNWDEGWASQLAVFATPSNGVAVRMDEQPMLKHGECVSHYPYPSPCSKERPLG